MHAIPRGFDDDGRGSRYCGRSMGFDVKLRIALLRAGGLSRGLLRRFVFSRRGNIATIFALSLVPMTVAAGAGVDIARSMVVRTRMSEALDAAALAVGSAPGLTQSQAQALAQKYFNANYTVDPKFGTPAAVSVSCLSSQSATVSTDVPMPTTLDHGRRHQIGERQGVVASGVGPDQAVGRAGARQYRFDVGDRQHRYKQDDRAQVRDTSASDHAEKRRRQGWRRRRWRSCRSARTSIPAPPT